MVLIFFPGVGLILGGGYSWVADQYGLGIDNVVSFDLVLPNGTFVIVSETNHPEILFGLKGGLNNFGIISGVTMYAHPLGAVWVCWLIMPGSFSKLISAILGWNDYLRSLRRDLSSFGRL